MEAIINKSLEKGISYKEYRQLVTNLLAEGKSTGTVQSEELSHYSLLNETRMNRLDKTIQITSENIEKLNALQKHYIWLVLSEGWCGDAAQILPVLNKMADNVDKIELRVFLRDENEELMNQYLTNGAKAIPKLLIIDKATLEVVAHWGPRPKGAVDLIRNYKEQYGVVDETIKTDLQKWYLKDKGISIQNEVLALM